MKYFKVTELLEIEKASGAQTGEQMLKAFFSFTVGRGRQTSPRAC